MNLQEYSNIVRGLAKDPEQIIDDSSPGVVHLLHMAVGLAGEVAEAQECIWFATEEIDMAHLKEELGDSMFYIVGIINGMGWSHEDLLEKSKTAYTMSDGHADISYDVASIGIHCGNVLDAVKKAAIYGQDINEDRLQQELLAVLRLVVLIAGASYITVDDMIDANVAKLSKRYPNLTYSNAAAKERADKQ